MNRKSFLKSIALLVPGAVVAPKVVGEMLTSKKVTSFPHCGAKEGRFLKYSESEGLHWVVAEGELEGFEDEWRTHITKAKIIKKKYQKELIRSKP